MYAIPSHLVARNPKHIYNNSLRTIREFTAVLCSSTLAATCLDTGEFASSSIDSFSHLSTKKQTKFVIIVDVDTAVNTRNSVFFRCFRESSPAKIHSSSWTKASGPWSIICYVGEPRNMTRFACWNPRFHFAPPSSAAETIRPNVAVTKERLEDSLTCCSKG